MKKSLLTLLVVLVLFSNLSRAQTTLKEDKKYNKALKYFKEDKIEKAIETIKPLLIKYQEYPEVWDAAMAIYLKQYEDALKKDELISVIQASMDSAGKKDPQFSNITFTNPSERYLNEFLDLCYTSTLKTKQLHASMYLRVLNVDPEVDRGVSQEAKIIFTEAELSFHNKDYEKALDYFDKAIAIQPDYYKAILYKGDACYSLKDYENAIIYFKKAASIHPDFLEPRKYLTDAYIHAGKFDEALEACIDGILIYPEESMFNKLSDIARAKGKKADVHWMARNFDVNRISENQEAIAALPWKYYRQAREKVLPYCDPNGIIVKENSLCSYQFMEVYSWEEMLKNSGDEKFSFAKKAMEDNYLDCYAFVSEFHYGIYEQYKIFANGNSEKIRQYIKTYLIK
jgi:tetratricopeptide (TPR) repeat protein